MSELEKINAKVKEQMSARRNEAIRRITVVLLKLLFALCVFFGLYAITFISGTFLGILMAVAVCVATFRIGYIWRDIKF